MNEIAAGVSEVTLTWISPLLEVENQCARALPGWPVPENGEI